MTWMDKAQLHALTHELSPRPRATRTIPGTREQMIRARGGAVFSTCLRILGDEVAARDATLVAFDRAFDLAEQGGGGAVSEEALHHVAIEAAVSCADLTIRPDALAAVLPSFEEDGHRRHEADRTSIHTRHGPETLRAIAREKMKLLPSSHRIPLLLLDGEQMELGQAAELLGLSRAEVRARVRVARLALHELVEAACN